MACFRRASGPLKLPASRAEEAWRGPQDPLGRFVLAEARKTLEAYRAQPHLVTEHANQEYDTAHGGYAHRQLYELIQNGADALTHPSTGQTILVRLTERFLYCADDGKPIDEEGVKGLMFAHMSSKRGTTEIGRFGMGFKSVLGVSDAPEFYSRSGSVRFNRARAAARIRPHVSAERYPTLRLPEPMDAETEAADDGDLRELMSWATNIVRLPLAEGAFKDLATQLQEFPAEFLLFVPHVRYLTLECEGEPPHEFTLHHHGDELSLDTGTGSLRWRCYKTTHALSEDARADRRTLDDTGDVQLAWAAPLDRLAAPGRFWAFFPTKTASPLAGILNAPWKTDQHRQRLLPGPYNDELMDVAVSIVAEALPLVATRKGPTEPLDALLLHEEAGDDEHSRRLREGLVALDRLPQRRPSKYGLLNKRPSTIARASNMSERPKKLLQQHHAWEPGADKRDFQWRMRLLQSLWREEAGLRKGTLYGKLRGACLAMPEAREDLTNYLTQNIRDVVRRELDDRGNKLYGIPRIYNNLLSSQPLSFNLFGELMLDLDLATRVLADMSDHRIVRVRAIRFEFSPGRGDSRYTGDRSAFDVYVLYEARSGGEGFAGIEVKYHESLDTGKEKENYANHGGRYEEIAESMGCFDQAKLNTLRRSGLQQIWRDHLLMGAHKDVDGFEDAFFVLLHPKVNSWFLEGVQDYSECLSDKDSFQSWTLEGLVERLKAHSSAEWIAAFHRRYLDFSQLDDVLA